MSSPLADLVVAPQSDDGGGIQHLLERLEPIVIPGHDVVAPAEFFVDAGAGLVVRTAVLPIDVIAHMEEEVGVLGGDFLGEGLDGPIAGGGGLEIA